jgi:hypothetical protein
MKSQKHNDTPLCQFGPGGEFVSTWPADATPIPEEPCVDHPGWSRLAKDLGYEPPLVATGPEPMVWAKRQQHEAMADAPARTMVGRVLDVLRRLKFAEQELTDTQFVEQHIEMAEASLSSLGQTGPVSTHASLSNDVLEQASAPLAEVARSSVFPAGLSTEFPLEIADHLLTQERENGTDTTEDADFTVHSGLSDDAGLFPVDAGDWGPSGSDESHGVRTRRRTRKRRATAAGGQAQRSLFEDIA